MTNCPYQTKYSNYNICSYVFLLRFHWVLPVDCAIKSGPRGCGKLTHNLFFSLILHNTTSIIIIIEWNVLFIEKIFFVTSPMGLTDFRSTACKHYRKWDVTYRYRHIELIWRLSMVQYLQNNVIMKWTTSFTSFNGWIPLKYGSTATPPIIAHGQNLRCQASNFTLRSPKTSNIRRTPSFDLLTDEFSKRVSIIRRALY